MMILMIVFTLTELLQDSNNASALTITKYRQRRRRDGTTPYAKLDVRGSASRGYRYWLANVDLSGMTANQGSSGLAGQSGSTGGEQQSIYASRSNLL